MKNKVIRFAQKALVLKKEKDKFFLLLVKYKSAPLKNTYTVEGKYGCPGGKIDFGEDLDESLIRECEVETGVTVVPKDPVGLISWQVEKPNELTQIVAVFRMCNAVKGKLKGFVKERTTKLEKSEWVDIKRFNFDENLVKDEIPIIKKVISHL